MKLSASQLFATTMNMLRDFDPDKVTDETIKQYMNFAKRVASFIEDEKKEENTDITPSAEEVNKTIRTVMKALNNKASSKSALINAILIKGVKRNIAEFMVSKAEGMGLLVPHHQGLRIFYTLAKD